MKSYEVYCRKHSQVIQAESITMAMSEFWSQNPTEEIIIVENIEARNEAPSSTPQSVEGIKQLFDKNGFDFDAFEYENEFSAKAIIGAMQEYGNEMFEAGKMMEKVIAETAIKKLGDKEREIEGLNKIINLWRNLNDKQEKEINESEKEVEYWKARCEAAEKLLSTVPIKNGNWYLSGFDEYLKTWQALKNKKPE